MNRVRWIPLFLMGLLVSLPPNLEAQPRFQGSMVLDSRGLQHLHVSVGHVYGVNAYEVQRYHPAWLYPEEVPVLHLIAREARVSPQVVLALREAGWSWWEISVHLRVRPRAFTAHLPYQPSVGGGYADWQVVEWVNVGFWAQVYRRPVREVIVIRERVPTWTHVVHHYAPAVVVQAPVPPRAAPPVAPGRPAPAPVAPPARPAVPRTNTQPRPTAAPAPSAARNSAPTVRAPAASAPTTRAPAPATRAPAPATRAPAPATRPPATAPATRAPAPATRTPAPATRAPAQQAAPRAAPPATRAAPPPPASAARGGGAERRPAVRPPSGLER